MGMTVNYTAIFSVICTSEAQQTHCQWICLELIQSLITCLKNVEWKVLCDAVQSGSTKQCCTVEGKKRPKCVNAVNTTLGLLHYDLKERNVDSTQYFSFKPANPQGSYNHGKPGKIMEF